MEKSGRQKVLPASVRRGTTTFARRSPLPTGTRLPGYRFSKSARKARCTPAHNPVSEGPPPRDRQRQDSRRAVPGPGQPLPHVRPRQFRRAGPHETRQDRAEQGPRFEIRGHFDLEGSGVGSQVQGLQRQGGHPLECGHLCCSVLPADPSVYNERNGSACLSASDCPAEQHLEELPKGRSIRFSIEKCIVFGCH